MHELYATKTVQRGRLKEKVLGGFSAVKNYIEI